MKILRIALPLLSLFFVSNARASDPATAANTLGIQLYRAWAKESPQGNIVLSPYSIEAALTLAYVGAEGTTRAEMAKTLGLPDNNADVQKDYTKQQLYVSGAVQAAVFGAKRRGLEAEPECDVADRLFGQDGFAFRQEFLDLMKNGFDAPFQPMDFVANAEQSRATINGWVSGVTHGKIGELIPSGALNPKTRLVLANAIYFKVPWDQAFSESFTTDREFKDDNATVRTTPTMSLTEQMGYSKGKGYTAVSLPYLGGEFEFLILLPDPDSSTDALASELTSQLLSSAAKADLVTDNPRVELYVPKFQFKPDTRSLMSALTSLGIRSAFDDPPHSANFDGIAPRKPDDYLYVGDVVHQAEIEVDENGTEAAAATAVIMMRVSSIARPIAVPEPIVVHVDRPFLFAIRVKATGLCLFLGRVSHPQAPQ